MDLTNYRRRKYAFLCGTEGVVKKKNIKKTSTEVAKNNSQNYPSEYFNSNSPSVVDCVPNSNTPKEWAFKMINSSVYFTPVKISSTRNQKHSSMCKLCFQLSIAKIEFQCSFWKHGQMNAIQGR